MRDAAAYLLEIATSTDPDRLLLLAREQRDAIDELGIRDREAARREQRSLRIRRQPDGMTHLSWLLDPESAAAVTELFDRATSPRRGGPRFVNADDSTQAARMLADTRSTEQLASDVFLDLLRAGADADSTQLLGSGAASVRIIVAATALTTGVGSGRIEGQTAPVSLATVKRLACGGTTVKIRIDGSGQPLDVGREQRLYSRRQRIALSIRDGGCRWPGCDRPPSWTEAHHTQHWARDHGSTNIADGILLCRHHHLLSHNNHWEITHDRGDYSLIPPPDIDPMQTPRPMPTKNTVMRELVLSG